MLNLIAIVLIVLAVMNFKKAGKNEEKNESNPYVAYRQNRSMWEDFERRIKNGNPELSDVEVYWTEGEGVAVTNYGLYLYESNNRVHVNQRIISYGDITEWFVEKIPDNKWWYRIKVNYRAGGEIRKAECKVKTEKKTIFADKLAVFVRKARAVE